jgi:hypothetical protein
MNEGGPDYYGAFAKAFIEALGKHAGKDVIMPAVSEKPLSAYWHFHTAHQAARWPCVAHAVDRGGRRGDRGRRRQDPARVVGGLSLSARPRSTAEPLHRQSTQVVTLLRQRAHRRRCAAARAEVVQPLR